MGRRRPVTIRTLDAGGDKPIVGLTQPGDINPFLGVRGVRLSLRHLDVFRAQLRATGRAAVAGNLKVMIPMITVPRNSTAAARFSSKPSTICVAKPGSANVAARHDGRGAGGSPLPSRTSTPTSFPSGSNDLIHTCAASRDEPNSPHLRASFGDARVRSNRACGGLC